MKGDDMTEATGGRVISIQLETLDKGFRVSVHLDGMEDRAEAINAAQWISEIITDSLTARGDPFSMVDGPLQ